MSYQKLTGGSGIQWPCNDEFPEGRERLYTDGTFATDADYCVSYGKDIGTGANLKPAEYKAMKPEGRAFLKAVHYEPPSEQPDDDYPLWLSTGRNVYQFHTRTKTSHSRELNEAAPDGWVQIHPEDAAQAGIGEGDWVKVESRRGALEARSRLGDIPRGRLFVPFHYGYWDDPGHARAANELTLFEWDPASKQPHYKFLAVRITHVEGPTTSQPDEQVSKAVTWQDLARYAGRAVKEVVKPTRSHVVDYLGMAIQSEEALLSMFEKLAVAHAKDAGVHAMTIRCAAWTRGHLLPLREAAERLGESTKSQPQRLASALDPKLMPTGFGLVRDLHDCWIMANETHICLRILHQAALAQRDEQLKHAVERADHNNKRQREWLLTKIMEASPQAVVVPE